jgi:hypothetical protein
MTEFYILEDRRAVPVADISEWARRFEITDRHVAVTEFDGGHVSTVFLGVNHRHGEGPPLIFESMVFGGEHDGEQRRYSTWEEAEKGHAELVSMVRPLQ